MSCAGRFWEVDGVRGIAILMMVVFHILFDLDFFSVYPVNVSTGFWRYFGYATASLFLLIAGVSLAISHARAARYLSGAALAKKFLLRGAGIFCLGLLITLVTWWYLHEGFIIFGILHLIGVSVMISPLFFRFKKWNAVLGVFCIPLGWYLATQTGPLWLLALGLHPALFWTVDYTPLFPWFGLVLIGMALGEYFYPGGERRISFPTLPEVVSAPLAFLGQHSLLIYLVHQPVILLCLYLFTGAPVL
jgi:uncharacterized membrane protein